MADELTQEEKTIVESFRKLKEAKKKAVAKTQSAFEQWLKEDLPQIWQSIKDFVSVLSEIWEGIKSLFFA